MKKINFYIAIMTVFIMFSCQKEVPQDDVSSATAEKQDWLTANLDAKFAASQKKVTAYLFPTEEMAALVKTPNVSEVRFVLGYADNTIQIEVTGVDKSGKKLGTVKSTILKETNYDSQLVTLKKLSVSKTNKRTQLLNEHLLLPNEAVNWIESWKNKLNTVSDLNKIISYEGTRFRYFSLESEIVASMVEKSNTNIGLFLGINSKGKVTTILIGLDKINGIAKTSSSTSKEIDEIYDGLRPCPPFGDPEEPQLLF